MKQKINNEATAILKALRSSTRKVGLVTDLIRGKKVQEALRILSFCKKRVAIDVKKLLSSAISNAENNHGMDIDTLYVSSVSVGKDFVLKRFRPRAKGRAAGIIKEFSNISLSVKEYQGE